MPFEYICDFSLGGFLCSFPKMVNDSWLISKQGNMQSSLSLLSSSIPAKSGFVKMVPEFPGIYVCNGFRAYPMGYWKVVGDNSPLCGTVLCTWDVKHTHLLPLTGRGSTPTPPESPNYPLKFLKIPRWGIVLPSLRLPAVNFWTWGQLSPPVLKLCL